MTLRQANKSGRRRVHFHTASSAAVAQLCLIPVHRQVTQLAAHAVASGQDFSGGKGMPAPAVFSSKATEAAQALAVLGYTTQEVQTALKGVDVESLPLEEIIRQSLKKMVK